jgi:cobalt-zinc-cadmium efflux system outer membrane protein
MVSRFVCAPRVAHLVLIACAGITAHAQGGGAETLSLTAAVEQTLERNPDLQGFAFRLRAQQARADSAAFRPPFEIRAEVEDAFGTGRASGVDTAEATFSISQVVELGEKRARRVAAAEAGRDLVDVERSAAQLDVLAELTRRFIHVAADQEQLELTRRATELARETLSASEARVAAARASDVEQRRARIALARAQIEQEHAEHELLASRRKLAAMWGDSEASFGRVAADLYSLPETETFEALSIRLEHNPDFARFASEARLRDAEIRLAESRARSDLAVSAGVRRLQQTRDHAFVFGVTVPLGSAPRARGAIVEAEALRNLTDAERVAHQVRAAAQLFELYQELRHAITETETLRSTVLPEMQAALEATRTAFQRGRLSYLEWVDAQRELVDVERALIEAATNAHLYFAEIERLTGEPLSPTSP